MTDPRSSAAPGPSAGYLFQLARALARLSEAGPGDRVGIETEDDVVRESADGTTVREQDKHSIVGEGHAFGDRSVDLWKSLANWGRAIANGDHLSCTLELHLVTNRSVRDGLARQIASAQTGQAVARAISSMRQIGENPGKTVKPYVDEVLALTPAHLRALVERVRLYDAGDATSGDALWNKVAQQLRLPDGVDPDFVMQGLLGWLQQLCTSAWQSGKPAWVDTSAFNNQVWRLGEKQRTRLVLRAVSQIPVAPDVHEALRGEVFVRQINLLEFDDDSAIIQAMNDFFRAEVERSRIVERGDITMNDWLDYEATLIDRWSRLKDRLKRSLKSDALDYRERSVDVGRQIFDTTMTNCIVRLAGVQVDEYLSCGQYHHLADDGVTVGWHPDFDKLLGRSDLP